MKFSAFYGLGGALRYTPQDVDRMTLWELTAAVDGFVASKGGEQEPDAPSYDEHLEMVARVVG